jgi:hypothetical protein
LVSSDWPAVALEEAEGRDRLEDRGPDGVEVHRAGHDRDDRLARAELGGGHLVDVQALARVLVAGGDALEHALLVLADDDAAVGLRHLRAGQGSGVAGQDGVADLVHGRAFRRERAAVVARDATDR